MINFSESYDEAVTKLDMSLCQECTRYKNGNELHDREPRSTRIKKPKIEKDFVYDYTTSESEAGGTIIQKPEQNVKGLPELPVQIQKHETLGMCQELLVFNTFSAGPIFIILSTSNHALAQWKIHIQIWTLPPMLKPSHSYKIWVNCGKPQLPMRLYL